MSSAAEVSIPAPPGVSPVGHAAPRFRVEVRATLGLALPLAGAQLAQMGMGVTDTILLGSLGRDALAAGGLAAGVYFTVTGLFQNALAGVGILVAHARGADQPERIAPVVRAGVVMAALLALPLVALLWNVESVLNAIGQPPQLARDVTDYVRVLVFAAPAAMLLATLRTYLAAMNHPRTVLAVAIGGLVANGVLNYGLIYGRFGLPELGYLGSATASAIVLWAMLGVTAAAILWHPGLRVPRAAPARHDKPIDWAVVAELNRLGWPISITFAVEVLLFVGGALVIGTMGNTPLAAHQVTINIAAVAFMVPLGLGQAANVRVGYHLGAGLPAAARRAGFAALAVCAAFNLLTATLMLAAPRGLAALYQLDPARPADAEVIALVVQLLAIGAFFQLFDGAQAVAAGILRGYKDTRVPMLLAGFSYWGIGAPAAWGLGITLDLGAAGVWWGLALGLAAAAVLLCRRFLRVSGAQILLDAQKATSRS